MLDQTNLMSQGNCTIQDIALIAKHQVKIEEGNQNKDIPRTFQEAWHHPDEEIRQFWREAIRKEFRSMIKRGVWRVMKKTNIGADRKCIKCKWVFNIKRNGTYRARLVACGYSQIAGVDFTENYSPVVNDISFRILLIIKILFGMSSRIVDVETAFLHGDLKEDIYMNFPDGLQYMEGHEEYMPSEDCVKLEKSLYGLVQAAREWWKKLTSILRRIGFTGGTVDPCLMFYRSEKGQVFMAIYVDDCLCIGDKEAIKEVIEKMEAEGLKLKIEENLEDYLNC